MIFFFTFIDVFQTDTKVDIFNKSVSEVFQQHITLSWLIVSKFSGITKHWQNDLFEKNIAADVVLH